MQQILGEHPGNRPPYMNYPNMWDLAGPNRPRQLAGFLTWLTGDDDRMISAAERMEVYEVGFVALQLATLVNDGGEDIGLLQVNFYRPDGFGTKDWHDHARDADAAQYASPGVVQNISRGHLLSPNAPYISGMGTEDVQVVGNCLQIRAGQKPGYHPVDLGEGRVVHHSTSQVPSLGWTHFRAIEKHRVECGYAPGVRGRSKRDVLASVHRKGPRLPPAVYEFDGLVGYKGLAPDQAGNLIANCPPESNGALSIVLAEPGSNLSRLNADPPPKPSQEEAVTLLLDSLHMIRRFAA
jgi:hypothetical protein